MDLDPRGVCITKGIHGKPEAATFGGRNISFNVAHSKDTILIALNRQGAVGIDVEYLDRATDIMEVAEANFTKQDPFFIEPMNETAGKILVEGNSAAAIGCMMAGVTVVGWYPIMGATLLLKKVPFCTTSRLVTEFSKPRLRAFTVKCMTRDSPGCMGGSRA